MHRWNETIQTGSDMRTRIFYSLAGVALAGAMAFVLPTEVQAAANPDGSVDINSTNFPDTVFEARIRISESLIARAIP